MSRRNGSGRAIGVEHKGQPLRHDMARENERCVIGQWRRSIVKQSLAARLAMILPDHISFSSIAYGKSFSRAARHTVHRRFESSRSVESDVVGRHAVGGDFLDAVRQVAETFPGECAGRDWGNSECAPSAQLPCQARFYATPLRCFIPLQRRNSVLFVCPPTEPAKCCAMQGRCDRATILPGSIRRFGLGGRG